MITSLFRRWPGALLLLFGLAVPSPAQDGEVRFELRAAHQVIRAGAPAVLLLDIEVQTDTMLNPSMLAGYQFDTSIGGKKGPRLSATGSARVRVAGGTRIQRRIEVDLTALQPLFAKGDLTRVSFSWIGRADASAVVSVAPDLSNLDVDRLDLAKTRVLLRTNLGDMTLRLFPDKAPKTVRNFLELAKSGFYDETRFHRVIRGFMIQGGCPNTKPGATGTPGTGDPGYKIDAEFNDLRHTKGVLSMARSTDPDSAGCQFFIMHGPNPGLDGQYTGFGELVDGEATLDKIANTKVEGPADAPKPVEPVVIEAAIVQPVLKSE